MLLSFTTNAYLTFTKNMVIIIKLCRQIEFKELKMKGRLIQSEKSIRWRVITIKEEERGVQCLDRWQRVLDSSQNTKLLMAGT